MRIERQGEARKGLTGGQGRKGTGGRADKETRGRGEKRDKEEADKGTRGQGDKETVMRQTRRQGEGVRDCGLRIERQVSVQGLSMAIRLGLYMR